MGIPPLPDVKKMIFFDLSNLLAKAGIKEDISPSAPNTGLDNL